MWHRAQILIIPLLVWGALAVALRYAIQLEWSLIAGVMLGVWAAVLIAARIAARIDQAGVRRIVSLASPRVWTLRLNWSDAFLAGILNRKHRDPRIDLSFGSIRDITLDVLWELRIEEYPTRLRAHYWTTPRDADPNAGRYDWQDVPRDNLWQGRDSPSGLAHLHRAMALWSYSTDDAPSVLNLSAVLRWDRARKVEYLELSPWVEAAQTVSDADAPTPEEDILFTIPLDPGMLDEREGRRVFVKGRQRKATEVHPYPYPDGSWEGKSGPAGDCRWLLHMRTFVDAT